MKITPEIVLKTLISCRFHLLMEYLAIISIYLEFMNHSFQNYEAIVTNNSNQNCYF